MKFTPRILRENVNVSKKSPLREFFVLLSGILGCVLAVYLLLGVALDIVVDRVPQKVDRAVGVYFSKIYDKAEHSFLEVERETQKLLDALVICMPENDVSPDRLNRQSLNFSPLDSKPLTKFTVRIVDNLQVNALALPGGNIVVFTGLLKEMESENELAMVLAHELGHFEHRDHLRGLGRGVVLALLSGVFLGIDSSVTEFIQRTLLTTDLRYSRKQEVAADSFALDLICEKYGHAGGAVDFFERTMKKEKLPAVSQFFLTHPLSRTRRMLLQEKIKERGYEIKEKISLSPVYHIKEN